MSAALAPSMSAPSNHFEHEDSTQSLLSRRGSGMYDSEMGSRYLQVDDSGVYLTSVAVTVMLSAIATIGILLLTLVITLAILLASCQSKPDVVVKQGRVEENFHACSSFTLNRELNNLRVDAIPGECKDYVDWYMKGGQYENDVRGAIGAAESYLCSVTPNSNGSDAIVMDIDETALSNLPYFSTLRIQVKAKYETLGASARIYLLIHSIIISSNYTIYSRLLTTSSELHNETAWNRWIEEAKAPALTATLELYQRLQTHGWALIFLTRRHESQRNSTVKNLLYAGYSGWTTLIMRSEDELHMDVSTYKSRQRLELQRRGFRIRSVIGDQWSDIRGLHVGDRTFKIPNPMYYIL